MNKKGITREALLGLIIGIVILAILFPATVLHAKTFFWREPRCHEYETLNSFNAIVNELNKENPSSEVSFNVKNTDCVLTAFNKGGTNKNFKVATQCYEKQITCLCICDGRDNEACLRNPSCWEVNIDEIKIEDDKDYIEGSTGINFIYLKKEDNTIKISLKKFLETTPQGIAIVGTERGCPSLNEDTLKKIDSYDSYIKEASEKYTVPVNLIKAVIAKESLGEEDAISSVGAVGLMQLMPGTAMDDRLGDSKLNVPDYGVEELDTDNDGKLEIVSRCNYIHKLTCDKNSDERFNPEKNIMAGTKYLSLLLQEFIQEDMALAAYNYGEGRLKEKCCYQETCQIFENCKSRLPEETRIYSPCAIAYKEKYYKVAVA